MELCGLRVQGVCCKVAEATQTLKRGTAARTQVNARRFMLLAVDAHIEEGTTSVELMLLLHRSGY